MKVLLCEANPFLRNTLNTALTQANFVVDVAVDGKVAWELLHAFVYDLVIMDVQLPKQDGMSLCQRLRAVGNSVLILVILAADRAGDRLRCLENGADGYITQPFSDAELLAHIQSLTRRRFQGASVVRSWGPLRLNPIARKVTCQGQLLQLSRKEYQLLELFLSHPRQMFSRAEMGDRLWNLDEPLPSDATIKTHIRNTRYKLEKIGLQDFIQTHYGQGYCLNPIYESTDEKSRFNLFNHYGSIPRPLGRMRHSSPNGRC